MLETLNEIEILNGEQHRILFLDQLDSFSYNIIHLLEELIPASTSIVVVRYDDVRAWDKLLSIGLASSSGLVIGPGPGKPSDYPKIKQLLHGGPSETSVLGVCLGMQIIGELLGFAITNAKFPIHGKSEQMIHVGRGLFKGIDSPMQIGRYHSLVVHVGDINLETLPAYVEVPSDAPIYLATMGDETKQCNIGSMDLDKLKIAIQGHCGQEIMAFDAEGLPWKAVQFHPESVLTPDGKLLISNWIQSIFG